MQNPLADTQYAFHTANMWFNFQAHHHCEYATMETQDRATQANRYSVDVPQGGLGILCTLVFIGSAKALQRPKTLITGASGTLSSTIECYSPDGKVQTLEISRQLLRYHTEMRTSQL